MQGGIGVVGGWICLPSEANTDGSGSVVRVQTYPVEALDSRITTSVSPAVRPAVLFSVPPPAIRETAIGLTFDAPEGIAIETADAGIASSDLLHPPRTKARTTKPTPIRTDVLTRSSMPRALSVDLSPNHYS